MLDILDSVGCLSLAVFAQWTVIHSFPFSCSLFDLLIVVLDKSMYEYINVQIRGSKALVLESFFIQPLGLVADAATLKDHGIDMYVQ